MSDSDDDECCPELVEEDLTKVGNINFYVFLEDFEDSEESTLISKYVPLITF